MAIPPQMRIDRGYRITPEYFSQMGEIKPEYEFGELLIWNAAKAQGKARPYALARGKHGGKHRGKLTQVVMDEFVIDSTIKVCHKSAYLWFDLNVGDNLIWRKDRDERGCIARQICVANKSIIGGTTYWQIWPIRFAVKQCGECERVRNANCIQNK